MRINYREIYTKSNMLSIFRLLLGIPIYYLVFKINDSATFRYLTIGLVLFATLTDLLDGYLARKYNEITEFGKIIDPFADKIVVGIVLIQLYFIKEIPLYYLIIVIGRDLLILLGGLLLSQKIGKVLPSNMLGKITVLSIGFFILSALFGARSTFLLLYDILFYLSISLVFISFFAYTIRAIESVIRNRNGSV
ncbi:MAG: CDP-alcohol phosphatidyltransferase family protein [Ignavibacteriales bacterium]|nr:CDP-alcohol phosphatidyltransferase family protein [Ignavibacteriales bacterium]